jgi:hypothetical protein
MKYIAVFIFNIILSSSIFAQPLGLKHFLPKKQKITRKTLGLTNEFTDYSGTWRNLEDPSDEIVIVQDEDNLNIDETNFTLSGVSNISNASSNDTFHETFFTQWTTDHKRIIIQIVSYNADLPNEDNTNQKDFNAMIGSTSLSIQDNRLIIKSKVYLFMNGKKVAENKTETKTYEKIDSDLNNNSIK